MFTIELVDKIPTVGDYLIPDGWRGLGSLLMEGDPPVDSSYKGSQFRLKSYTRAGSNFAYPINLKITSRKLTLGKFSKPAIRVEIEWVNDGEPNTHSRGWLVFNN